MGELVRVLGGRMEGEVAMFEHGSGSVAGRLHGLHAEVAKHGV